LVDAATQLRRATAIGGIGKVALIAIAQFLGPIPGRVSPFAVRLSAGVLVSAWALDALCFAWGLRGAWALASASPSRSKNALRVAGVLRLAATLLGVVPGVSLETASLALAVGTCAFEMSVAAVASALGSSSRSVRAGAPLVAILAVLEAYARRASALGGTPDGTLVWMLFGFLTWLALFGLLGWLRDALRAT
jgi:hypothetical protein